MNTDLIFVALSTFAERDRAPLDLLERSGRPFKIHASGKRITPEELRRDGPEAAVIVAGVETYDAAMLDALPTLRCIARVGVGVDAIDHAAARQRGVAVVNTPDLPAAAVAELALSMFLSLSRQLVPQTLSMRARRWERLESHLLGGRRVGIVGLGRIGRRVAELSMAFGAEVMAHDPFTDGRWAAERGVRLASLDELLEQADILSLHAARSKENALRLSADELARMKPGAILVNLARGGMVDEAALHDALLTGHLGGAGLDVFDEEPYRGPLCDLENVILTPHSATMPVETRAAMEQEAVDKALRFLDGTLRSEERVI